MISLRSLFPKEYNWFILVVFLILLRVLFINISFASFFAISFSIFQFTLLFNAIGKIIPTRHLFGSLMCLQFFVGPVFAYNGLDTYQYFMYQMKISEMEYFTYAIPAVLAFIIGLHLKANQDSGEKLDLDAIRVFVKRNPMAAPVLIVVGFASSVLARFFTSDIEFMFYLVDSFKIIVFYLLLRG